MLISFYSRSHVSIVPTWNGYVYQSWPKPFLSFYSSHTGSKNGAQHGVCSVCHAYRSLSVGWRACYLKIVHKFFEDREQECREWVACISSTLVQWRRQALLPREGWKGQKKKQYQPWSNACETQTQEMAQNHEKHVCHDHNTHRAAHKSLTRLYKVCKAWAFWRNSPGERSTLFHVKWVRNQVKKRKHDKL